MHGSIFQYQAIPFYFTSTRFCSLYCIDFSPWDVTSFLFIPYKVPSIGVWIPPPTHTHTNCGFPLSVFMIISLMSFHLVFESKTVYLSHCWFTTLFVTRLWVTWVQKPCFSQYFPSGFHSVWEQCLLSRIEIRSHIAYLKFYNRKLT